ncbi:MAG: penicillin-binding protein 2 [Chloroflexi bacterium]|nr:penicillin-binding protein 2 [Chloroflexota bacterium]
MSTSPSHQGTVVHTERLRGLRFLALLLLLIALYRVADWQILRHDEIQQKLRQANGETFEQSRKTRGMILDRNGLVLAMDVWGYQVSASPDRMGDEAQRRKAAEQLAILLQKPTAVLWDKLADPTKKFMVLDYQASFAAGNAIRERHIAGVALDPQPLRHYPAGAMAAQTIGFVNLANRGYGVEQAFQPDLNGTSEDCRASAAGPAGPVNLGVRAFQPTPNACDLVLTLDWAIQDVAERELTAALEHTKAPSGSVIVIEPSTGKILAMASLPAFDLNKFYETKDTLFSNPAISSDYEPGSVVKIMTMAAGLDSGLFAPSSTMWDSGEIIVGGVKIHNWDNKGHGKASMTDCLALSLNVCAAYLSTSLGPQKFYDYATRFGFAQLTGVDIANEIAGQMRFPDQPTWHISDLGTNSFGQGMTATPLQVAMMASAIANGGILMKPFIVEAVINQGHTKVTEPKAVRRVVTSETARQLATMLADAIEKESIPAIIPTARVAGKTGTASIVNPVTHSYDTQATIASFVGWAPYDDPKFVILVKLDKPQTTEFGSLAAAPVFREIAKKLMVLLDANATVIASR